MSEADRLGRFRYFRPLKLMRKKKSEDQEKEKSKTSGDQLVLAAVPSPEVASSTKADTPALEGVSGIGSEDEATSPARQEALISGFRVGSSEKSFPPALVGDKALPEKAHYEAISKWNADVSNETQKSSLLSRTGNWAPSIGSLGTGNDATILWDFAYDLLQRRSSTLMEVYEEIISNYLTEKDAGYESEINWSSMPICAKEDSRRRQMDLVIQSWLAEHESSKDGNGNLIAETSLSLRDILRSSIERSSYASLPWAAACIATEVRFSQLNKNISSVSSIKLLTCIKYRVYFSRNPRRTPTA